MKTYDIYFSDGVSSDHKGFAIKAEKTQSGWQKICWLKVTFLHIDGLDLQFRLLILKARPYGVNLFLKNEV